MDWLEERVQQILDIRPDMIVLIGDIVTDNGNQNYLTKLTALLKRLEAPLGVWVVRGNHESKTSIETFEKAGDQVAARRIGCKSVRDLCWPE